MGVMEKHAILIVKLWLSGLEVIVYYFVILDLFKSRAGNRNLFRENKRDSYSNVCDGVGDRDTIFHMAIRER